MDKKPKTKRTMTNAKKSTIELNRNRSTNNLQKQDNKTKKTTNKIKTNRLVQSSINDVNSNFKANFDARHMIKGGFRAIFKGELHINTDDVKNKDNALEKKKNKKIIINKKNLMGNKSNIKDFHPKNAMTNENNKLNKQATCKDKFYKTSKAKANQEVNINKNPYKANKIQNSAKHKKMQGILNEERQIKSSKKEPALKKIKSEKAFDNNIADLNLEPALAIKEKRSLSRAKCDINTIKTERPLLKDDLRNQNKEEIKDRKIHSKQKKNNAPNYTSFKGEPLKNKKHGIIMDNKYSKRLISENDEDNNDRMIFIKPFDNQQKIKSTNNKPGQKKLSMKKKHLSIPSNVKIQSNMVINNNAGIKKQKLDKEKRSKAHINSSYLNSVTKIQKWWRRIYKKQNSLELIEIDNLNDSDNKTVVLLNTKTNREHSKPSKKEFDNVKNHMSTKNKQIKHNLRDLIDQTSKGNSLKNIVDLYEDIQTEQLDKWKDFYNTIKKLEIQKTNHNPILQKIKTDSIHAINFLSNKFASTTSNNEIYNKQLAVVNSPHILNIANNVSIENKSFERYVSPPIEIYKKHNYNLFKENFLNQSGKNSKSLILPKPSTDKSVKSEINRSKKEDSLKDNISDFYRDSKPQDRDKSIEKSVIKSKFSSSKDLIVDFIADFCFSDLIRDKNFKKLINSNLNEGVQISVNYVHKYLNDISEHIIFTYLQEVKDRLKKITGFDLENYWIKVKVIKQQINMDDKKIFVNALFYEFNKKISTCDVYSENQKIILKTFNRCLFDALEEALTNVKSYSLCIYPYTYLPAPNISKTEEEGYIEDISSITLLEKACNTVLTWNDTICGIIISKNELTHIKDEMDYINQVKEERMTKFISQDIQETQNKWHPCPEVLVDIAVVVSDNIEELLLQDMIDNFLNA